MLLSVLIPTYQQEKYIAECIESVLSQSVIFDIEVLVGDDCSSDATAEVVRQYAMMDGRVKLFQWPKNEGGLKNIDKLLSKASGKYVSILEGDDYFYDNNHLQYAIESLEKSYKISFIATNFDTLSDGKLSRESKIRFTKPKAVSFWHLALGNFIQLGSIVYRRELYPRVPTTYIDLPLGDYPMTLALLQHSDGMMLPHTGLVYRIHSAGIWSMKETDLKRKKTIETIMVIIDNGCNKFQKGLLKLYISRLRAHKQFKDYLGTLIYYFLYLVRLFNFKFGG